MRSPSTVSAFAPAHFLLLVVLVFVRVPAIRSTPILLQVFCHDTHLTCQRKGGCPQHICRGHTKMLNPVSFISLFHWHSARPTFSSFVLRQPCGAPCCHCMPLRLQRPPSSYMCNARQVFGMFTPAHFLQDFLHECIFKDA